jgi:mannosyltransferase
MMRKFNTASRTILDWFIALPQGVYLGGILVIAALARLLHLTKADIWHDEGYTMMLIDYSPLEIITRTMRDVHAPLYYLAAHCWQALFGDSEFAIRSLSVVFGLLTIVVMYFLLRRLFSEAVARLGSLLIALGPFAVRYSEEARMYAMASFLVAVASYLLVCALDRPAKTSWKLWLGYALILAAGLYTHYYFLFIIPVHVGYAVWKCGFKALLTDKKWWAANLLGAALFIPWVPTLLAQVSRVQAGFWIPPVTSETLPNTLMQFLLYRTDLFSSIFETILLLALLGTSLYLIVTQKKYRFGIGLLLGTFILPLVLVFLVSLKNPVYYDRYFIYCAVALYALLAAIIVTAKWLQKHPSVQLLCVIAICALFLVGINNVGSVALHKMGVVGRAVSENFRPGDKIISAELYTYFDFSYYNRTGEPVYLLSEGRLNGYGETSLIYDRQDQLVVHSLDTVTADRVWLVGKVGEHDYYKEKVPSRWKLINTVEAGDSAVRLYETASAE